MAQWLGGGGARPGGDFPPLVPADCRWSTTMESPARAGQFPGDAARHQCRRGRAPASGALSSGLDECYPCAGRLCARAGGFFAVSVLEMSSLAGRSAVGAWGYGPRPSLSQARIRMLAFLGKTVRCNILNGLAHSEERRLDTPDNREAPIRLHFGSGPPAAGRPAVAPPPSGAD